MKSLLEERIERRICIAEEHMQRQNSVERFFSKIGLATANATDKFVTWLGEDRPMNLTGTLQGAITGLVIAFFAVAICNLAAFGGFIMLGGMVAGGLFQGLKDGTLAPAQKIEERLAKIPDKIAQGSGALPSPIPSHATSGPEETLRESGRDPRQVEEETLPLSSGKWGSEEMRRREQQLALTTQQQGAGR